MTSDHLGTDDRPRDALSAAHTESLAALAGAMGALHGQHSRCRSVDGCPWPLITDFDARSIHDQLIAAGYQVVPI